MIFEELVEYQCQTLERIVRAIIRNCVENEKLLHQSENRARHGESGSVKWRVEGRGRKR